MFEDSSWINAVHSCSGARDNWWSAAAEVKVFNVKSQVSHFGLFNWWTSLLTVACGAFWAEFYKDRSGVWHG
jgi:hypothetical protein